MKETIIALAVTLMVAALVLAAIRHGQYVAELERAVTVLERELAHSQTMLDDAKRIIPHLERRVVEIKTDRTAREIVWMLQETIGDCAMVEVY